MKLIPIYTQSGHVDSYIELTDNVTHVSGRTSRSGNVFFKGVGSTYSGHSSLFHTEGAEEHPVFYYGYKIQNPDWLGKYGIFMDKFQPYFSDWIGTCGQKELNIITNSRLFLKSAVEVLDCIEYDETYHQMYFKLLYKTKREPFLDNYRGLLDLLVYMTHSGWNFPWDKASINDINNSGNVTDVADMFKSNQLIHIFGTVYSVLYSLHQINRSAFQGLTSIIGVGQECIQDIPGLCARFLNRTGFSIPEEPYCHLVGNILLRGRNCAGVEDITMGAKVMTQYLDRFLAQLTYQQKQLIEDY